MANDDFLGNAYTFLNNSLGNAGKVVSKGYNDISKYMDKNPDMAKALTNTLGGAGAGYLANKILGGDHGMLSALAGAAGGNILDAHGYLNKMIYAPNRRAAEAIQAKNNQTAGVRGRARNIGMVGGAGLGSVAGSLLGRAISRRGNLGGMLIGSGLGGLGGGYLGRGAGGIASDLLLGNEG